MPSDPAGISGDQFGIDDFYQTASNRQPSTDNYLLNNAFKFSIERVPTVTYFCQKANIPSLSFGFVEQPTKFGARLDIAGSLYEFETLEVSFIVSEDMRNWLEIFRWLRSLGNVEDFNEYVSVEQHKSDAELLILSSAYRPQYSVNFLGVFPTNLSGIDFDSSVAEAEPVIATASFKYRSYDIIPITT